MTGTGPSTSEDDLPVIWRQKSLEASHTSALLPWVGSAGLQATLNEWPLTNQSCG